VTDATEGPLAWPGTHDPLGAQWSEESTNFAVWAREATSVWVCLFDEEGVETRWRLTEQTLGVWHGAVPGVEVGQRYGYRADGPWSPETGRVFNPAKLLLDPYATAVCGEFRTDLPVVKAARGSSPNPADTAPYVGRSLVTDDRFDWEDDAAPRTPWAETVIYETHVRGFTRQHPDVPAGLRGTYAGLAHPAVVDYLRDLGVTAVELLPVQEFVSEPALQADGRVNYWGYNPIAYFAPHQHYSSQGNRGGQISDFKHLVKQLHRAGIEVILDVVYNHTAEAAFDGPVLSYRGLDDISYYMRVNGDTESDHYFDSTGCGNTLDATHPAALRLILDSLRYWVEEMHVDGFRFDLASALTRTHNEIDMGSDFLVAISQDPVLRRVKLIAEPWDVTMDGYLTGSFPPPWCEWNDRFRDTVRDFWRTDSGGVREVASRLAGSSDMYADDGRSPYASINFITAHDGFTLRDLVSYNEKHNEDNGEDNRDGADHNRSWNCGVEGETDDPEVLSLRHRQAANLMATLCLATGVPMISAGDERGRTRRGNNNPYVQDNEISWMDWSDGWWDLHDLTRRVLALRRDHPALRQRHHFEGTPTRPGGPKDLVWLHPHGHEMTIEDWHDGTNHALGMFLSGTPLRAPGRHGEVLYDKSFLIWFNALPEPMTVHIPEQTWGGSGDVVLSTDPAHRIGTPVGAGGQLTLCERSLVVLRSQ
jgi:glycogen operon protein